MLTFTKSATHSASVVKSKIDFGGIPLCPLGTPLLIMIVLEVGRYGKVCHTGTSSFCSKPYRQFLSDEYHPGVESFVYRKGQS